MGQAEKKCPECGKTLSSDLAVAIHRQNAHGIDTLTEPNKFLRQIQQYVGPLCSLGIHSGVWTYVDSGACEQARICSSCGQTQNRTKHQWYWQYVEKDS